MALTVTSVSPASGLTGGRELAVIDGTDFNISVDSDGKARMRVKFGAAEATRVRVRSTTRLDCLTPISPLNDPGVVSVTVEDLDAVTSATLANAFTYKRPTIGGVKSDLWYVVDRLIVEMRRQIIANVVLTTQIEYDADPSDILDVVENAKVPALVLVGPDVTETRGPHARIIEDLEPVGGGAWERRRSQDVETLRFMLHVIDDKTVRATNLLKEVISFFRRNDVLRVPRDSSDPNSPIEEIEMRPPNPGSWRSNTNANNFNLRHYSGEFSIVGVPIGHDDAILTTQGGDADEDIEIEFSLESERLED